MVPEMTKVSTKNSPKKSRRASELQKFEGFSSGAPPFESFNLLKAFFDASNESGDYNYRHVKCIKLSFDFLAKKSSRRTFK